MWAAKGADNGWLQESLLDGKFVLKMKRAVVFLPMEEITILTRPDAVLLNNQNESLEKIASSLWELHRKMSKRLVFDIV